MRRAAALLLPLVLAGTLVWVLDPLSVGDSGGEVPPPSAERPPAPSPEAPPVRLEPLLPRSGLPPALAATIAEVRGLLAEGRVEEAAALLLEAEGRHPEAAKRKEFRRAVARVQAASTPPAAPAAVARPVAPRTRYAVSRDIADLASTPEGRAQLRRHVERFVPREGGDVEAEEQAEGDVETAFQLLLQDRADWRKGAPQVPVTDVEGVESRRIEQLERLAERGATELLDPLHGALVWLTLHQGDDGRISSASVKARCQALGHGKTGRRRDCLGIFRGTTFESNAVGSTALCLLALLDFRDQDARAVFEPHLGRGIAWLLSQQQKDGTFGKRRDRQYYATAIAVMALAQAANASGRDDLRRAVARGLQALYAAVGPDGGYRYRAGSRGDLSVSGWVAQAIEAARWAEIEIPERMDLDLRFFLDATWLGKESFGYLPGDRRGRESLYPVGMLMGHILWEETDDETLGSWRKWSRERAGEEDLERNLYTLYYGVRVGLLLEDGLVEPWKTSVKKLVEMQVTEGSAAGMFPRDTGLWLGGPVATTALAALTLEHALYER